MFLTLLMSFFVHAQDARTSFQISTPQFQGFVKVRPGVELYVDYVKAKPGYPTIILLNGLTYSTKQYVFYAHALAKKGVGVLRFDFDGMGQSLLKRAPSVAPYPYEQQVADTLTLARSAGLPPPYHFAGLSYGGGIGLAIALMHPRVVKSLLLIAPYTQPLTSQDQMIKTQIAATRVSFPGNTATDDELYDFFLRQIVYSTYPFAEPIVLENPYKLEGVFNLVRGIRKFRAIDFADRLPPGTVHMMVAGNDQYVPRQVLEEFWSKVNPRARMSRVLVYQTEHKIPEFYPEFVARWTLQIMKGNPILSGGRAFEAWPLTMTVKSGGQTIPLED